MPDAPPDQTSEILSPADFLALQRTTQFGTRRNHALNAPDASVDIYEGGSGIFAVVRPPLDARKLDAATRKEIGEILARARTRASSAVH